jgi:two-component sensor histidine kinase
MKSYFEIAETPGALLLLMIALFLQIGQTAVALLSFQEKNRGQTLRAALHMLLGFLVFVFMLEAYDLVNYPSPKITRYTIPLMGLIRTVPWAVYALLELLSSGILLYRFLEYRRYRTGTVTPAAIRQTLDLLPEGICVSGKDGTVLLTNLKMDALCRELTGDRLSDARRFWAALETRGEDQGGKRLISAAGEVWLFDRETLAMDGQRFDRTSAVNVTERYRITEELREKNARLQEIQRRMKEAAKLSGEMFVRQEEAAARSALHNELGQVLLMGRHYIEHPESTDRAMVALMTRQMNRFLLGETSRPSEEDPLRTAIRMAESIGVTVELRGRFPQEPVARSLLAQAIRECAANTVKHAEGDRIEVVLLESAPRPTGQSADPACHPERSAAESKDLFLTITNNGKPPKGEIAESGGLLSLRRSVETAGGRMRVQSLPRFELELTLPPHP